MKKLLISMLAVATLASCAKEETLSFDKGEAIQFGNAFVENSTRAIDPSYSAKDINSFKVYGTVNNVNIYNGNLVSRPSDVAGQGYGVEWTCAGTQQYWIAGADYKFVGIVDGDKDGVTKTNLGNYDMPSTIDYTADGKTDLLCQNITRKDDTSIVGFNFTHLLSKVNFTVVNGSKDATGYSFVVKSITFKGATEATYDVVNAKWNDATATGNTVIGNERTVNSSTVKDIVVATGAASAELGTEVLFIPGTYTISFTVDILYNGNLVATNNYPVTGKTYTHTLAAANAYNFKVNVSVGKPIQFTVTSNPTWNPAEGGTEVTIQ